MILYLLPFKNGKHFKFGVTDTSKRGFARPYSELDPIYEIDFTKALMVTAKERDEISILENEIKRNYGRYFRTNEYKGNDGASEILPIEYFDQVISFIKEKARLIKWQCLRIEKMPERVLVEKKSLERKQRPPRPLAPIKYLDTLKALDFFHHPYGKRLLGFAKNDIRDVRLYEFEMPGIFRFIKGFLLKSRLTIQIKNGFRAHEYTENSVTFYFDKEGEKLYVNFKLHDNLLNDVKKGEDIRAWGIPSYELEGEPKSIDLNLLEDAFPPTEEEIEYSRLEELAYRRMIGDPDEIFK